MDLDPGEDHGIAGPLEPLQSFADGLGKCAGVAVVGTCLRGRDWKTLHVQLISRQLEVRGLAVTARGLKATVDIATGGQRVIEDGVRTCDALEDLALESERAEAVVQQRVLPLLGNTRRTADDHHGRGLRVGTGDGIDDVQSTDPVGHRQRADATAARIAVGRKGGGVLTGGADVPDGAAGALPVKAQHIVAGHTEHMIDTGGLQTIQQVLGYSRVIHDIRPRTTAG
jgi:hypothetical protein